MKKIACVFLAIIFIFQLGIASFAIEDEAPQGGLTPEEARKTNSETIDEILNDPNISDELKQQVVEKTSCIGKKKVRSAGTKLTPYVAIMQEDAYKCAPAVVQQSMKILFGLNYVPDSQTKIQSEIGQAPGMNAVLNYLDARQSRIRFLKLAVLNTDEIDDCIDWSYANNSPIIFTFAANTSFWPYPTSGHFTNLAGYSGDQYQLIDPFYYTRYVGISGANGILWRTKAAAWKANTMLFSPDYNFIGY